MIVRLYAASKVTSQTHVKLFWESEGAVLDQDIMNLWAAIPTSRLPVSKSNSLVYDIKGLASSTAGDFKTTW